VTSKPELFEATGCQDEAAMWQKTLDERRASAAKAATDSTGKP
jgi:hypothetical protein